MNDEYSGGSTRGQSDAEPPDEIREIRETIEQTRAQMSQTIGELQERLSPAHIKAQIREQVKQATIGKVETMAQRANDTMTEARQSIVETISANPVPAALVGIGLAWLWANRRSNGSGNGQRYARGRDDYYGHYGSEQWDQNESGRFDRMSAGSAGEGVMQHAANIASRAGEAVSGAVEQVQQRAGQMMDQARQTTGRMMDQAQQTKARMMNSAQEQTHQAQVRFNDAMNDSPLAVGAIALAVGTAVGLALPQTRKENEWMGETRDNLVDTARSAVQDATEQVRQVARDTSANVGQQQQSTSDSSSAI